MKRSGMKNPYQIGQTKEFFAPKRLFLERLGMDTFCQKGNRKKGDEK
jgi:hypothetical protein